MSELELMAKALYESKVPVGPSWEQLGNVTKSVWLERAAELKA
jgi:hypothetical protein